MRKWPILPPVLLALTVAAWPQARGGFGGFGGNGFGRPGFGVRFGSPSPYRGFPGSLVFFGDSLLYPDYSSAWEPMVQPPQPIVIVQSNPNPAPSQPPSEPLMIVRQGDHYVRFEGRSALDNVRVPLDDSQSGSNSPVGMNKPAVRAASSPAQAQLPPAVLVFRDGHREQVEDYVIASGKLYVRGDYWRDGYWTKTVELAALDLPRTLSVNQENGVNFVLPAGPNVVVTRP